MSETHCPACGANYAIVGRVHRCRGYAAPVNTQVNAAAQSVNNVVNKRLAALEAENAALRAELAKLRIEAGKSVDRKAYMREYMRGRRERQKAATS